MRATPAKLPELSELPFSLSHLRTLGLFCVLLFGGLAWAATPLDLNGKYTPLETQSGLRYESLEIESDTLVYVGLLDPRNHVAHRGSLRITRQTEERIEFESTTAVITATLSGIPREMTAQFTGVLQREGDTLRLTYRYKNIESTRAGIEEKSFRRE